jgi:GxxExxY protein
MELIFKDEVFSIVGAAMKVHSEMGPGFLEAVYQEAMEIEMSWRQIPFVAQQSLSIYYCGQKLRKEYIPDLICYEKIIVELKTLDQLSGQEESQVLNYLKATKFKVGILINFGSHNKLEWRRLIF